MPQDRGRALSAPRLSPGHWTTQPDVERAAEAIAITTIVSSPPLPRHDRASKPPLLENELVVTGVRIRPVRGHEADSLYRKYRDTVLVAYAHIFPPGISPFPDEDEQKKWRDLVAAHGHSHQLLVADIGSDLAGAVVARPGELERFFVVPSQWGTGIADALHDAAIDVSYRAGAAQCQLEVLEANGRARRFYERHGWVRDHRSRSTAYPPHLAHLLNAQDGLLTRELIASIPKAASSVRTALNKISGPQYRQIVQRSDKWLITDRGIARIEARIEKEALKRA